MLPAAGAEVIAGCAFTVLTAISFHFVTSLAEATAGTASAAAMKRTTSRPLRLVFIALGPFLTPVRINQG